MRQQAIALGFAACLPTALAWVEHNPLMPRQTGASDRPPQDVLCKPESDGGDVAPCISIEAIEAQCAPNGTEPIYLDAHAQCMCNGSFFAEKIGCERCLNVHGLRSEREFLHYQNILSVVSEELCTGTPTAVFASLYSSAQLAQPSPTTGETRTSDQANGETDVSYYYTASGVQGPGQITGAAASATAEATTTDSEDDETTSTTGTANQSEETDKADTTSGDGSGALPTAAAGGIAWGMAGAAILAAL